MKRVTDWQQKAGWNPRCDTYEFYEEILERKDIDVVSIATPDHWHALAAIHACQASKDVYLHYFSQSITGGLPQGILPGVGLFSNSCLYFREQESHIHR